MKKSTIITLVKYGVGIVLLLAFAGVYLWEQDVLNLSLVDQYRVACDAFTLPGLLLMMFTALIWLAGQGALDGVTFCVRYLVFSLIPGKRVAREETFAQYVERKSEKRLKGYGFIFWIGLGSFVVGQVFFILYGFATDWAWFSQLQS